MNYRIEEKEAFCIIGIKKRVPIIFSGVNPEIAAMWKSLDGEMINTLKKLSNVEPIGLISASTNFSEGRMEEKGKLIYGDVSILNGFPPQTMSKKKVQKSYGIRVKM